MRISDWSSDVCSSDLLVLRSGRLGGLRRGLLLGALLLRVGLELVQRGLGGLVDLAGLDALDDRLDLRVLGAGEAVALAVRGLARQLAGSLHLAEQDAQGAAVVGLAVLLLDQGEELRRAELDRQSVV